MGFGGRRVCALLTLLLWALLSHHQPLTPKRSRPSLPPFHHRPFHPRRRPLLLPAQLRVRLRATSCMALGASSTGTRRRTQCTSESAFERGAGGMVACWCWGEEKALVQPDSRGHNGISSCQVCLSLLPAVSPLHTLFPPLKHTLIFSPSPHQPPPTTHHPQLDRHCVPARHQPCWP